MPVVINGLTKRYGDDILFKDFSISLDDRVINCILGASGCGKTTLLNIIAGLDKDISGTISGTENATFSYVFQETRLLKWYTVYRNLFFVLKNRKDFDIGERIEKYLSLVGLWNCRDLYPHQLSGGMKQRLSIARAFAYPSDILLMDEPFKGQDPSLKEDLILEFLKIWEQDKRTVLFVTHDIDEVLLLGDKVHILGERPARGIYTTEIVTDKRNRDLNDGEMIHLKKRIYEIFKNNKGEDQNGNGRNENI
ncbi:MAG: ABC transporter ATP-binding protein [Clostridia bacterium]